MKGLRTIILTFFCIITTTLVGYSYEVKVLRKWQPQYTRYHYWIGFSDFHDKLHAANGIQRKKIEEHLPEYKSQDLFVIVEDLSSPNDSGRLGCGSYYINSKVGVLAGLGTFCSALKIPSCNVEYRYCRVVALGPVINNISADPSIFSSTKKMSIVHLMEEVETIQNDLLFSNHGLPFKGALEEKLRGMQKEIKKLNLMPNRTKTVAEYLADTSTPLNRLDLVKNLLTFDGILIGFKIVDATMKKSEAEKIVVFAGGTHVNEAYELLQKVAGYEPVTPTTASLSKTPSVVQSISMPVGKSSYYLKPSPLSLDILEHYLKN